MEEVDVWHFMLRWGVAQTALEENVEKWDDEDFAMLRTSLKEFLPLIRFTQMSADQIYDRVWPYHKILPPEMLNDIVRYYLKRNGEHPVPRVHKPRTIPFDSNILTHEHVSRIADWIDRKDGGQYNYEDVPYRFELLVRGTRDGFDAETFHDLCDHKGRTIVVMCVKNTEDIIGGYNPLEWSTAAARLPTQNSFIFSFGPRNGSVNPKICRVQRPQYAIHLKDRTHGPCFGDKDLWMRNKFNEYQSCSCEKDDYSESVLNYSRFSVTEYEVFAVMRK
jgi:hypothetical protein